MSPKADAPIICGVGQCKFTHTKPTVIGRHRWAIHGIAGQSKTALKRREAQSAASAATQSAVRGVRLEGQSFWIAVACPHCQKTLDVDIRVRRRGA